VHAGGQHQFSKSILQLRNGELNSKTDGTDQGLIEIPEWIVEGAKDKIKIITTNFGKEILDEPDEKMVAPSKRVILKTKNVTATELNLKTLDLTPREGKIYQSMHLIISDDKYEEIHFPVEFSNQQCPYGMPHKVKLKAGACIILPSNLGHSKGLLNGTTLLIRDGLWDNTAGQGRLVGQHCWSGKACGTTLLVRDGLWDNTAGQGRLVGQHCWSGMACGTTLLVRDCLHISSVQK
jgi:hypothetical protein